MAQAAAELRDAAVSITSDGVHRVMSIERAPLSAAHPALRRMVIWCAMNEAAGGGPVSFHHVASALRLLDGENGDFDAPGQRVQRIGDRLVLTSRPTGTVGRWKPERPRES